MAITQINIRKIKDIWIIEGNNRDQYQKEITNINIKRKQYKEVIEGSNTSILGGKNREKWWRSLTEINFRRKKHRYFLNENTRNSRVKRKIHRIF